MNIKKFPIPRRILIRLVVIAVAGIYGWYQKSNLGSGKGSNKPRSSQETTHTPSLQQGEFQVFTDAQLAPSKYNDGDSFLVKHGNTEQEYRLYFVDTPESRDKPYSDHRERVLGQGKDLGGLDYRQALEVGKSAKATTKKLLSKPFQVFTTRELVYEGPRQHAFIQIDYQGETRWLHEVLVEQGLARIHTRGAPTPDGDSYKAQKSDLYNLQKKAQASNMGAWKY